MDYKSVYFIRNKIMECATKKDIEKAIFKSGQGYFVAYGSKYKGHHNTKKQAIQAVKKDIENRCRHLKKIYIYY